MKVLLAGNIGREAAIADRLAREGQELHIAAEFPNPSLVHAAEVSEGQFYQVKDATDPKTLSEIAVASEAQVAWINQDDALANGAVDAIRRHVPEMFVASPDRQSSQIEWDKFDSREIISEIDKEWASEYNPRYMLADSGEQVAAAIDYYEQEGTPVVIKPRGLTGGKGVKVMGPHLADYQQARQYALEVISDPQQGGVSIEEKLEGHEFTIQGLTDGKTLIVPPATYDYPYREDGDIGPGTGGMGSFTMLAGENLPFITDQDYEKATDVMREVLAKQNERGRDFKGVLYGSFFKTPKGIKVVEFNARIGDPEGINIMELMSEDTSLIEVLNRVARQELREQDVRFKRMASAAIYLVSPDYAYHSGESHEFELNLRQVEASNCRAYFAAAEQTGHNRYRTSGSSRTVALASRALTPWEARANIHEAISTGVRGPLVFRQDIADHDYIKQLGQQPVTS